MNKYAETAVRQQPATNWKLFDVIRYSLLQIAGEVQGKSVLDLTGDQSRQMKELGARRVVAVDAAFERIKRAMQREALDPLGVEYVHAAPQTLGKIGNFDLITGVMLLDLVQAREDLLALCRTIYNNLAPGGRFIAASENAGKILQYPRYAFWSYGFVMQPLSLPLREGSPLRVTLLSDGDVLRFDDYYHTCETFDWALRTAGFSEVNWHMLQLPPQIVQSDERPMWQFLVDAAPVVLLEGRK